ncbi:hypothetical protein PYU99_06705 [Aeromonas media]|uniref:hypothetical protein n=1 Tax=Aeromonas TaxID=642 RepID=UPI0022E870FA|nr:MULTISPECIES: hypothetical protein [Aeromonas]WED82625.1 hypothetical protein PYU99_06705 [Aeromonas media]
MNHKLGKTEIQLAIFEETLERLIKGEGKYVVAGSKLSMAQLAREAGVGSGTLYYKPYSEFRVRAMKSIAQYNVGHVGNQPVATNNGAELLTLRDDRNNEKRLKENYRETCNELRDQVKRLCAERCAVEHALYVATVRVAELELKFEKVTGKQPDEYFIEERELVSLLPRNLQLIK